MSLHITSTQNGKIKQLVNLQKHRERRKSGTFLIEGIRETSLAQQSGIEILEFYLCMEIFKPDAEYEIRLENILSYTTSQEVYAKVAYRESTGGILAVAKTPNNSLSGFSRKDNPLYLVLEQVEKPGNIGAVLRTADAAGIDGLIICDPATDLFNPNIIRASLGCLFTVETVTCTNQELKDFLIKNNIKSFATLPLANQDYTQVSYLGGTAILLGAESTGLSDFWEENADFQVRIPMAGKIDSLNISNAAAIFTFEALRQRNL